MHELFKLNNVFLYPARIFGVNFSGFEIMPMKFDTVDYSLELASECEETEAEFYSVFILIPDVGRDCIADCATKETANKLTETFSLIGEMYIRK